MGPLVQGGSFPPAAAGGATPLPAPPGPAPTPTALSVTDVLARLEATLRQGMALELWVTGTVAGLRAGPRFTTFELVDYEPDGTTVASVLSVGAYAAHARQIRATLDSAGASLTDGLQVTLWGHLDLNRRYGRLRLLAERADPRTTLGAAVLAREQLLAKLDQRGLLRAQATLPVPDVVRRLGLVSSPTAAGRADVLTVLERCPLPLEVVEAQAAVSGPTAPDDVAHAIAALAGAGVELILLARGGGAKSDLAAWDSHTVAMAIATCPVPVWSALGHATDHTVADVVASRCVATPSAAAAELVARARAALDAADAHARQRQHDAALASARRHAAWAVAAAILVVLFVALALILRARP